MACWSKNRIFDSVLDTPHKIFFAMPYISIESGPLSDTQKQQLIERITDVAAETTGIPSRFFMVTIKELPDTCFGIGGRTIDRIKREYAEK